MMISDERPHGEPAPQTNRCQIEAWIEHACILEAAARKPGNVHPEASFVDLSYADFLAAAYAVAPVISRSRALGVGQAVLDSIRAARGRAPRNVNLGIVLLLAPLAAVPPEVTLAVGIAEVLQRLSVEDATLVYEAIRLAAPGGMGQVESADVSQVPRITLLDAMRLAADRDAIAAQYASGFHVVLEFGMPLLVGARDFENCWEEAIIRLQLRLMAEYPDSLIARKCGSATAQLSADKARAVLAAGWPKAPGGRARLVELDAWLRSDGHRRNPGTTADLVAATLFAAFRDGGLPLPVLPRH